MKSKVEPPFQPGDPGGLYFHIPFCNSKCPYCDFYSLAGETRHLPDFVTALIREIQLWGDKLDSRPIIKTIFFGGGTPSLLTPGQLDQIFTAVFSNFTLSENCEITLEANPGEITFDKLTAFRVLGINRLSLGCQSFNDEQLKFLKRIHSAKEALQSFTEARQAEFDNINLDLIYRLPGQTPEQWENDLRQAADLDPEHISAYSLTVEAGTPLFTSVRKAEVSLPDEGQDAGLFTLTRTYLGDRGYSAYETSNFAKPGFRCRHNLGYWQFVPYLGFGPSAHSYSGDRRWWNSRSLEDYLKALKENCLPTAGDEELSPTEQFNERILNGLRLTEGVRLKSLHTWFTGDFETWLAAARSRWPGLVVDDMSLKLGPEAVLLTDEISADLFID